MGDVRQAKGFNIFLLVLIAVQILISMGIATILINSLVNDSLSLLSSIAYILLIMLLLPISFLLYRSAKDKILKMMFLGMLLSFVMLTLSGILWFIIPMSFSDTSWLIYIAKVAMFGAYPPLLYILLKAIKGKLKNIDRNMLILITFINVTSALLVIYFAITNFRWDGSYPVDITLYTLVTLLDILLISLCSLLIFVYMPSQYRYIFSIIFLWIMMSLLGDTLNLMELLGIYPGAKMYAQFFYDMMLILTSITLLVYSLSNIKILTVEEVNKKLDDTKLLIGDILKHSPDAMCLVDRRGYVTQVNDSLLSLFSMKSEDIIGKLNFFEHNKLFQDNENIKKVDAMKDGEAVIINELKVFTGQDQRSEKYLTLKIFPTYDSENKIFNYICLMEDITERKKAEEALKKAKDDLEVRVVERTKELAISNESLHKEIIEHKADEEKIKASLKEKEVLLKEIHHRVKNNLQIVSSLLDLQSMNVKDKDYVDMLKDSQNRIRTMALIHEKLYQSEDLAMINLSEYIKNLTLYLHRSYAANSSGVEVNIDVDDVFLNIDAAIPIGLIINELVSNSYKHAFPNGKKGEIFVKFHKNGNGEYLLEVGDNGVGIPDGFSLENATSLGLQLVNILAKENGRSIDVDRNNGTKFSIAFSNKAAVNI